MNGIGGIMTRALVIYRDNWADEMNIQGFQLCDSEQWNQKMESLKAQPESWWAEKIYYASDKFYLSPLHEIQIGTNETVSYESYDALKQVFEVHWVLGDEYFIIHDFFGEKFGTTPDYIVDQLLEDIQVDDG